MRQAQLDIATVLFHIEMVETEHGYDLAKSRAAVFKALGHPSRMLIVSALAAREASVGELSNLIGSELSTTSRHLTILSKAGILSWRKVGNRILYGLKCTCILEFLHCIDDVIFQDATDGIRCVLPGARITTGGPAAGAVEL